MYYSNCTFSIAYHLFNGTLCNFFGGAGGRLNMAFVWLCVPAGIHLDLSHQPDTIQDPTKAWQEHDAATTMTHSCVFDRVSLLTLVVLAVVVVAVWTRCWQPSWCWEPELISFNDQKGPDSAGCADDVTVYHYSTVYPAGSLSSRPIYDAQRCVFHRL